MKKVGFWYSEHESELPMPVAGIAPWQGQSDFMAVLAVIQLTMDNDAKAVEYQPGPGHSRYTNDYPEAEVIQWRGWSTCRICDEPNGSKEYVLGGFAWPQGYRHYLDKHNVEPDPEFSQFVKAFAERHISVAGEPFIVK